MAALFADSCAGGLCHVDYAVAPAEDLDLSPELMCDDLVEVDSLQVEGELRLAPGDPEQSYLLCKIDPDCERRAAGSALMPIDADPLSSEEIALVAEWIHAGAPGCEDSLQDVEPPQFAGASAATGLTSAIRLDWEPASDDVTPSAEIVYLVYESEAPGGHEFGTPSYMTAPGATSFTVTGLPVSTTRHYVVRARDGAGNVDGNTAEVSATTLDTADETAPDFAGLEAASPAGSTGALLSWSPAADDVSPADAIRYRAYVATSPGNQDFASPAAESDPGAAELVVTDLEPETTYFFVVRAVDAADNEDQNTVEKSATTGGGVSFSADVQPIFTASCTGMACHTGAQPAGGLDLESGKAYEQLVSISSEQCANRLRVAPGDPGASYLVDKIKGVNLCFGSKMPKNGSLPASEIQTIVDWIAQGAAND